MNENSIVPVNTLEITSLQYAHEQYDEFVDISCPLLTVPEFKTRRKLPLNEQVAAALYGKTVHLKDSDFIEIDRQMLQMIGFKNTWSEKKDKHGNIKVDEKGMPILNYMRNDFSSAIRCLRNTIGFVEGKNFNDSACHFIVQKAAVLAGTAENQRHGGAGLNKQSIWIRMRALEHFVIMANTCNSFMIREYFLDLKNIMTEYNMYQAVYRSKQALSIKDTRIDELSKDVHLLCEKIDSQTEKIDAQSEQIKTQTQKMDMLAQILYRETDNKVIDVKETKKKQELVILQNKKNPSQYEVLRGQAKHVEKQVKRKHNDMTVVGKNDSYKNPINLFNRFGETIKSTCDDRFKKSSNKIVLKDGQTSDDLMNIFRILDDDKHCVAENVKQCL